MRIWLISQYFAPEDVNPSARLQGFAKEWQNAGAEVFVLTGTPNHPHGITHPDYQEKPAFMYEQRNGLPIYRHWLYKNPDLSSKTRLLSQITFALSLLKNLFWRKPPAPNAIVVSTPSIAPALSAWLLAKIYRAGFIFELRDPWPEKFIELGRLKDGPMIDWLVKLQKFLLNHADLVVVPSLPLAQDLQNLGIDEGKVQIISDGLDDAYIGKALTLRAQNATDRLRTTLQISPMTKVVMYMGNHGSAQAVEQVLGAAHAFLSRSDVLFLLVGDGSLKTRLKEQALGLPNVQFIPPPPVAEKWLYYALADVCLITTKDTSSMRKITPPRVFEALGAGRPTVVAAAGITETMLNEARTALVTPPEDPQKLAYAIVKLIDNPEKAELLGKKAKEWIAGRFSYHRLAYTYFAHIKNNAKGL